MMNEKLEQMIAENHLAVRENEMLSIQIARKLAYLQMEPMRLSLENVRKTAYQRMTGIEKRAALKRLIFQTEDMIEDLRKKDAEYKEAIEEFGG